MRAVEPRFPSFAGPLLLVAVLVLTWLNADTPSALTRTTIHLALIQYAAALWWMIGARRDDWLALSSRGQVMRRLWTWASLAFVIHVACAFHFTHGWSHTRALEQTRLESGFGEGLYVNYAFTALWLTDMFWWNVAPRTYAMRSPWNDRLLHGFLLFIAFNATVVFETGAVRWIGLTVTMVLAWKWLTPTSKKDAA